MTPGVRPLVAGNWKMNGLSGSLAEIDAMRQAADAGESGLAELLVCPPATLIAQAAWRIKGGELRLGAQDCHPLASGALHRRHFRPDAQGRGRELRHRRPFRAAPAAPRDRRPRARQGGSGAEGGAHADRLRRRDAGPAGGRRQAAVVIRHCEARCRPRRPARPWSWLMSPCGRSEQGSPPRRKTSRWSTMAFGRCSLTSMGTVAPKSACFMAARSSRPIATELLTLENVDGALVGGASLRATEFLAIAAAYR